MNVQKISPIGEQVNRAWDLAIFLQLMAAFCPEIDFAEYQALMVSFHNFIQNSDEQEIMSGLSEYDKKLKKLAKSIISKYPLKKDYQAIAKEWNKKYKLESDLFSNGIMIGWLENQVDLSNYCQYDYTPYHFKIGLVIHKGSGEIEENFLLQDSFTCLVKAEKSIKILENFGSAQKRTFIKQSKDKFDKETLDLFNVLKYEISFYSRMTIISFYSFLECFVNSLGFDYYYRHKDILREEDAEILKGSRKGRFLNLKYKIEMYQRILRSDSSIKIVLSDVRQIKDPFKSLFNNYEELRNASVHFSPEKSRIWLKPHDWVDRAREFSKLVIEASIQIWESCHNTNKGPDYLGRLEFDRLYKMAESREKHTNNLEKVWLLK